MTYKVRKVSYIVHMDQVDDDGNVVQEVSNQEPLTLYGHQLDQFAAQVAALVAQANTTPPAA